MSDKTDDTAKGARKVYGGISIRIIGAAAIALAIILSFFAFTMAGYIGDIEQAGETEEKRYVESRAAIDSLQTASDYLTTQARLFVVTGRRANMDNYTTEITVADRRGSAVNLLKASASAGEAAAQLEEALAASDSLAQDELTAMRLAADYHGVDNLPDMVADSQEYPGESRLNRPQKLEAAQELVFGEDYENSKANISADVEASTQALIAELDAGIEETDALMQNLLFQLRVSVTLLLCVVMVLVLVLLMYVLKPLDRYIKRIQKNEPLEAAGAYELHYLADAYNTVYEDNSKRILQLREFAERDVLTGISNRSGYDNFLATHTRDVALILIDIDHFKEFNEVYGRETGDAVLVKLAGALTTAFRATDFPCRVESDKFAVIMTNMNENLRDAVTGKMDLVNSILSDDSDDLPAITLSVGAAFSTEGMSDSDIYRAADKALSHAQKEGRNALVFYGEHNE